MRGPTRIEFNTGVWGAHRLLPMRGPTSMLCFAKRSIQKCMVPTIKSWLHWQSLVLWCSTHLWYTFGNISLRDLSSRSFCTWLAPLCTLFAPKVQSKAKDGQVPFHHHVGPIPRVRVAEHPCSGWLHLHPHWFEWYSYRPCWCVGHRLRMHPYSWKAYILGTPNNLHRHCHWTTVPSPSYPICQQRYAHWPYSVTWCRLRIQPVEARQTVYFSLLPYLVTC